MVIAKIYVDGVTVVVLETRQIPEGIQGAQIEVQYGHEWNGLIKTAVLSGCVVKDVLNPGSVISVPAEVLAEYGHRVKVGFYGVDGDNIVAIPTLWADLGVIQRATDPSGDTTTDPGLPVWAQLQALIGDLSELSTNTKENLVRAVNEIYERGGGPTGSGENGATFIPHLADDGTLSWTNDKGLPNPEPINIKGGKGDPFTYEDFTEEQLAELKGDPFTYEDFTEEQLAELVNSVLAALPTWTGGSY